MTDPGAAPAAIEEPWRTGWFFVATAAAVAEDGDHVTVDLPDVSITIQNFRGTLAGFRNVCSHRSAQMRPCGRGRSPLRCPYHGWTYNREGVPVGIPENDPLFGLDAEAKQRLALPPVAVGLCGSLLFARVAQSGPPLRSALEPAATLLDDFAPGAATCVDECVLSLNTPCALVLQQWRPKRASRCRFATSNLAIDRYCNWMLIRAALPSVGGRTLAQAALFHHNSTADDKIPDPLRALFDAALR